MSARGEEQLREAEAGKDTRDGSQPPAGGSTRAGTAPVLPLDARVLEQIRTAGLVLPRPPFPGQQWKPRTGAEAHLLREAFRLNRAVQALLGEVGWQRKAYVDQATLRPQDAPGAVPRCPLTPSELRALVGAAAGERTADTSRRLLLAYQTIKSQRQHAVKRLGARSLPHAVAIAVKAGWITGEQITGGVAP